MPEVGEGAHGRARPEEGPCGPSCLQREAPCPTCGYSFAARPPKREPSVTTAQDQAEVFAKTEMNWAPDDRFFHAADGTWWKMSPGAGWSGQTPQNQPKT